MSQARVVSPIARTLVVRASDIAPLVNAIAAEDLPQETDPGVVGLLGQSGLEHRPHRARPPRVARQRRHSPTTRRYRRGAVARRHRTNRLSVCGYLVDSYCLGVKNALGPRVMRDRDLPRLSCTCTSRLRAGRSPVAGSARAGTPPGVRRGRRRAPGSASTPMPASQRPPGISDPGRRTARSPSASTAPRST